MSDYQGRQADEQPHRYTPSITRQSRKARGDCKCKLSINVISLSFTTEAIITCKRVKMEGNKLLLLLLLLTATTCMLRNMKSHMILVVM